MRYFESTTMNIPVKQTTRLIRWSVTIASLFSLLIPSPQVFASCDKGEQEVATLLMEDALANSDDIEKLVLLKQSLKACPDFISWVELGKVQLALDNVTGAAFAFENARDYYSPDADGNFTINQVRRQAIGNAWLADAYLREGELASASVATQEARNAFQSLGQQAPLRLVQLQAEIDDAMADADGSVLARSFQLQHERTTRGIGVRPVIRDNQEPSDAAVQTDQLETDYSGTSIASAETGLSTLNSTGGGVQQTTVFPSGSLPSNSAQRPLSESRLNIPVLFAYDSAELSPASLQTVTQLGAAISALRLDSSANVIVVGHTDSRGAASYNQQLSVRRANTVMLAIEELVQIKPIFESVGLGEQELRYAGSTRDDHRRNRRVEIIVRR